jgi:hypothetical protein
MRNDKTRRALLPIILTRRPVQSYSLGAKDRVSVARFQVSGSEKGNINIVANIIRAGLD